VKLKTGDHYQTFFQVKIITAGSSIGGPITLLPLNKIKTPWASSNLAVGVICLVYERESFLTKDSKNELEHGNCYASSWTVTLFPHWTITLALHWYKTYCRFFLGKEILPGSQQFPRLWHDQNIYLAYSSWT